MIKIYPKYKCFGCGNIWHSREILAICPICRGKGVKIKDEVDVKEVVKKLKSGVGLKKLCKKNLENQKPGKDQRIESRAIN